MPMPTTTPMEILVHPIHVREVLLAIPLQTTQIAMMQIAPSSLRLPKSAMVLTTIAIAKRMKVYKVLFTTITMAMDLEIAPAQHSAVLPLLDMSPMAPIAMMQIVPSSLRLLKSVMVLTTIAMEAPMKG